MRANRCSRGLEGQGEAATHAIGTSKFSRAIHMLIDADGTRIKPKAARVLASEAEQASFPKALEAAIREVSAAYVAAIFSLDLAIQQLNVRLHRTQPPKSGKISVRFYAVRGRESIEFGDLVDRVPVPVKWFKGREAAATAGTQAKAQRKYLNVRLRWNRHSLAEQRARGFDFIHNDGKTRALLLDLQRLLELRRAIRRQFTASRRGALRAEVLAERVMAATDAKLQKMKPKVDFLVYDDARHLKEIAQARRVEDRLRAPRPQRGG